MRENTGRGKADIDQYGSERFNNLENKRLNLNDLLDRAKLEKKKDRRNNTIIISGAFAGAGILYLLFILNN